MFFSFLVPAALDRVLLSFAPIRGGNSAMGPVPLNWFCTVSRIPVAVRLVFRGFVLCLVSLLPASSLHHSKPPFSFLLSPPYPPNTESRRREDYLHSSDDFLFPPFNF
ncbi:hypothetical protein DFJ73DRAFT_813505 [Zopfochytrium polystomum]|nr:hypothetical protein DFJ73DRAFT_813505 [Zopfochytrium polystomum]